MIYLRNVGTNLDRFLISSTSSSILSTMETSAAPLLKQGCHYKGYEISLGMTIIEKELSDPKTYFKYVDLNKNRIQFPSEMKFEGVKGKIVKSLQNS
jgi:hypothetical protein